MPRLIFKCFVKLSAKVAHMRILKTENCHETRRRRGIVIVVVIIVIFIIIIIIIIITIIIIIITIINLFKVDDKKIYKY